MEEFGGHITREDLAGYKVYRTEGMGIEQLHPIGTLPLTPVQLLTATNYRDTTRIDTSQSAQELYGVTPDLTTLSKILGGGFPSGAYGGRRDLMQRIAPAGPVYQAGTLSGNPVAMAAGAATLSVLDLERPWAVLDAKGARLEKGLADALKAAGVPGHVSRVGSMGTAFFLDHEPTDYASVKRSDTARFGRFHALMLERGVYLPPSQFEAWFLSTQHDDAVIDQVIAAAQDALGVLVAA